MTASISANLWMASTTTERDALVAADGARVGDLCLVSDEGLYVAESVGISASTWTAVARRPLRGRWSLAATRAGSTGSVRDQAAVSFQPELESAPSLVTLTIEATTNWNTSSVVRIDQRGFIVVGTSNSIAAGTYAIRDGRYEVSL